MLLTFWTKKRKKKTLLGSGVLRKEGPVLWKRQNVNCAIRWQLPTNWRRATQHGSRNLPLIYEQRQNSSRQLDDMKQFSGETAPLCSMNSNTEIYKIYSFNTTLC
jgi:hypothetical protein